MVNVINATGMAIAETTAIDLSPYLDDNIARLVGVRILSRVAQTVAFAGVIQAAHTHNVEAEAAHTHLISVIGGAAVSGAGHSHLGSVMGAGAFSPTVDAQGGHTPDGTGTVIGTMLSQKDVVYNGFLNAAYTNPAAGSVALTGRKQIHMGDALASTDFLELRVLYMGKATGIF